MPSTGILIRERREALGLTRTELAEKLGTTRLVVWRVETEALRVQTDDLREWATALKTKVEALVP
jgi:transcriptional regulator with XRE-family HTH domain